MKISGKLLIKDGITFDDAQDVLLGLGYTWIGPRRMLESNCGGKVGSMFFYENGDIKYSSMTESDTDWINRKFTEYTIKGGKLVEINNEHKRGS